ncbi:MAG TPA: PorV/PorQ family protein [Candidatus Cloacimonadota bacterium]|nr:PorV/PorQ family protein [Candidatus Cloacimonadota bacterium]
MKKIILILTMVVLAAAPVFLQAGIFPKTGTASLQFLKLGIDARATGMGEAYTAVTNDISSVYWNPAGLALIPQQQAFFSHTSWPSDIMHDFVAASYSTGVSAYAVSASVLHMAPMNVNGEDEFGPTGEKFNYADMAFGFTYASAFTDKFAFGFTGKYLREATAGYAINSYSVDLGSLYNTKWKNLTIGMSLRNFGPDVKYTIDNDGDGKTDEDPVDLLDNDGDGLIDEDPAELSAKIPMNFSMGVSADLYRTDTDAWIISAQLDNCIDRQETWNIGTEYKYGSLFARAGYQVNYDTYGPSFGLGWELATRIAVFDIDYAYTDMGYLGDDFFGNAHRVSLKMKF